MCRSEALRPESLCARHVLQLFIVDFPIIPCHETAGVHEFCMACENCSQYCPAGAVPKGEPSDQIPNPVHSNPGFRKWWINAEKCLIFWGVDKRKWPSCGGRCIAVCPWIKPMNWRHNPVRWLAIHSPAFIKKFLVQMDRVVERREKRIDR